MAGRAAPRRLAHGSAAPTSTHAHKHACARAGTHAVLLQRQCNALDTAAWRPRACKHAPTTPPPPHPHHPQWRARQARLQAQLTLDAEKRRELLKVSEEGLRRCLALDPSDGRTYVVLGKLLSVMKRHDEARKLYTEGCQNTGE